MEFNEPFQLQTKHRAYVLTAFWIVTHLIGVVQVDSAGLRRNEVRRRNATNNSSFTTASFRRLDATAPITFDELPLGTTITTNYAASKHVIFGPGRADIVLDEFNNTNRVLVGFPLFTGPIVGRFVNATTGQNITVKSFNFTIRASQNNAVNLVSNGPLGNLVGLQTQYSSGGTFAARDANIASFSIEPVPGGVRFSIDNFVADLATSGILFRQLTSIANDGSWGPSGLAILGFDHVAFNYFGSVYESHPGYSSGEYGSAGFYETARINMTNGVQTQHTLETFKYNKKLSSPGGNPVADFQEVPVDYSTAVAMQSVIQAKIGSAGFLRFASLSTFVTTHPPNAQKGSNNTFTGCGLVEWAAEQARLNGGQGFIPNSLESIITPTKTYPMLSPQLLYYTIQNQQTVVNATQSIKGFFMVIDYFLMDPLGRRVGVYDGTPFDEIPTTFRTMDGDLEFLVVTNPIPGTYMLRTFGIPSKSGVAVAEVLGMPAVTVENTGNSSIQDISIQVPVVSGSRGDVNRDGIINQIDLTQLQSRIPVSSRLTDPGDINGDGKLDQLDVDLLTQYLNSLPKVPTRQPTKAPAPIITPPSPSKAPIITPPSPSKAPTRQPTKAPAPIITPPSLSKPPTRQPTMAPAPSTPATKPPVKLPSNSPTRQPETAPTTAKFPTRPPTKAPSSRPTTKSPSISGATAALLFRELRPDAQDGSWGPVGLDIPGFDHVALNYFGSVYESHPGYRNGPVYVSGDGTINKTVAILSGVQNEHNLETFKHNSPNGSTAVVNFTEFPIDNAVALAMKNVIASKVGSAGFLGFTTVEELVATHQPEAQKGRNNTFTCVGLIEWAAEQAGINGGQGFVPNELEAISTVNTTYPLLSPQLLYDATQFPSNFFNLTQYIVAYFDPVDYLVTDPLNRRTGIVNVTRYNEIPNAISTPKGDVETLVISNPLPGEYKMAVYGMPGKKGVATLQVSGRPAVTVRTTGEASVDERSVVLTAKSGSRGDVNGDGSINDVDLTLLKQKIPLVVGGFANTGDMDGNGELNQIDVDLLAQYLQRFVPTRAPSVPPISAPRSPPTPTAVVSNRECQPADRCGGRSFLKRFRMHRMRGSRCVERCMLRLWSNIVGWTCGKCSL